MNREEHLQWSKDRAIQELESGNKNDAFASFMSDMSNHPELENHKGLDLGMMLSMGGHLSTPQAIRQWIEGIN